MMLSPLSNSWENSAILRVRFSYGTEMGSSSFPLGIFIVLITIYTQGSSLALCSRGHSSNLTKVDTVGWLYYALLCH